jgi:hypothetical protein
VAAGRADLAERYWTIVLGAELGAFATLPYLQTRPPWVLETRAHPSVPGSARLSVVFMQHATTGANTIPSGHAAGSVAVALAVIDTLPLAGTVLLLLGVAVTIATVATRAHFVVDAGAGVVLAVIVWMLARAAGL